MLVRHDRPRNVRWYLAAPMLFGDLGTSRLYVLGLAIFYTGTSAPYYVAAVGLLLVAVGWAYTVACRTNPEGGGVYSSGRALHPALGLIGATLLLTDFVVTAALSAYEAWIYIGGPLGIPRALAPYLSVIALAALGVLNYVGPKRAGSFALAVAVVSVLVTAVLAVSTVVDFPAGWRAITPPSQDAGRIWVNFTNVVLALSGIEAIANLTGIMVQPVARTARLSIAPVIAEVFTLNLVLIVAACAIPGLADMGVLANKPHESLTEYEHAVTERLLFVIAHSHLGSWFAGFASIVFGLLLLSASNTAILAMMNIQYAMSRDGELPEWFSRINNFGVPWYGLFAACLLPSAVVLLAGDVQTLAGMYAIGVVGAIAINLGATAYNQRLAVMPAERAALWTIGAFMVLIWVTIAWTKPLASFFLGMMLVGGVSLRFVAQRVAKRAPAPLPAPARAPQPAAAFTPLPPFDPARKKVLVATRGGPAMLNFAFEHAKLLQANVFVLFVRELAVMYSGEGPPLTPDRDPQARDVFELVEQLARRNNVPLEKIYSVSPGAADVILDVAATYACDFVILGASRRTGVMRALRGDVISGVAENLPAESTLLIHA